MNLLRGSARFLTTTSTNIKSSVFPSSSSPFDVTASLNYLDYSRVLERKRIDGRPTVDTTSNRSASGNFPSVAIENILIRDARHHHHPHHHHPPPPPPQTTHSSLQKINQSPSTSWLLDKCSFQLFTTPSSLSPTDFYHPSGDPILERYYPEMEAFLYRVMIGCRRAIVFHHQLRHTGSGSSPSSPLLRNGSVHGSLQAIDTDYSPSSAYRLLKHRMPSPQDQNFRRFAIVNAWRSIDPDSPVLADPLAVCDDRSLVKPDDYIESELKGPGGYSSLQFRLDARHSSRHRWYYFPQMTMDEILVFKQFDSKVFGGGGGDNNEENGGRFCFHTSFSLLSPNGNHHHQHHQLVEKDQQLQNQHIPRGRQSIEVRALILY